MTRWRFLCTGFLLLLLATAAAAQSNLNDPYEVLEQHFEANGGLDRIRAEQTQMIEGRLALGGLEGSINVWVEKPDKVRTEVDLGIFKITQGDNGEYQWVLDQNGKLQMITNLDEAALKRRELARHMAEFEYADPNSEIFTVTLKGIEQVEGRDCYVILIENSINEDVHTSYINVDNFMLEKSVTFGGEEAGDSYYSDYRDVDGLKVAYWMKQISSETGQEQELTISRYESNPPLDETLFEPPQEGGKDYRFSSGDRAENIHFDLIGNHIYLPVVVDCKERLWILDTGASITVLSRKFAEELGLQTEGNIKGKGAGGTIDVQFTTLPSFRLQGIKFDPQTAAVIDLEDLNRILGEDIAGILGYDFLSRFVTRVDYANELISFYDPETFTYSGDGRELDVHMKGSVFMVQAALDGEHTGTWLFDIGASTCSLDDTYAFRHGFASRKGVVALGRGAGNTFKTTRLKCKSFELAGFKVDDPTVTYSPDFADTLGSTDEIGGLGTSLFRNFIVYLDYLNERVILEPGQDFNRQFPENRSGLQFTLGESGDFEVMFVAPDTPGEQAGIAVGDKVVSVNGIKAEHLANLNTLRELMMETPGTEYTFLVNRNGEEKKLKLKLRDLL